MHIDGKLIPIFAIAVVFVVVIAIKLTDSITKYKLKVEQIKADALVRAEEVRSRNQLELEKLIRQEQNSKSGAHVNGTETGPVYGENNKTKSRVRE